MECKVGSSMEKKVADLVKIYSASRVLASSDQISVVCFNWKTKEIQCGINPNQKMQLASVVKVFIAAAYLQQNKIDPKKFPLDANKIERLTSMIANSKNSEANYFFDYLGGPAQVQKIIESLGVSSTIVEKISDFDGSTYKNMATAGDICLLYTKILNSQIPNSELLISILKGSHRTRAFSSIPTKQYGNKTGTTDQAVNDTGFTTNEVLVVMMTGQFHDNKAALIKLHNNIGQVCLKTEN